VTDTIKAEGRKVKNCLLANNNKRRLKAPMTVANIVDGSRVANGERDESLCRVER